MAITPAPSVPRYSRKLSRQLPKALGSSRRKTREIGVMAWQPARQFEELAEQRLAVAGKVGEINAALRAANRGDQRDCQHIKQFVAPGIARARIWQSRHLRPDRCHPVASPRVEEGQESTNAAVS